MRACINVLCTICIICFFQQQPSSIAEAMILDTEAAVIANFEFLGHTDMDMEEEEGDVEDEIYDANADTKPNKVIINNQKPTKPNKVTYYFILLLIFFAY